VCQREAVTITLLPGRGAELPWAGRSLRFGMTLDEVHGSVEPHAGLRDTFVCNAAWAREFALDGIRVCLFAVVRDVDVVLTGPGVQCLLDHQEVALVVIHEEHGQHVTRSHHAGFPSRAWSPRNQIDGFKLYLGRSAPGGPPGLSRL